MFAVTLWVLWRKLVLLAAHRHWALQPAPRRSAVRGALTPRIASQRISPVRRRRAAAAVALAHEPARGVYREHQGDLLYVTKNRAKPHRCNDRVEDVIQALFEGNPLLTVPPALAMARRCVASEPGKEPEEPYLYLDLPPPRRAEAVTGREPGKKLKARWFGRSRDEATRRASEEST